MSIRNTLVVTALALATVNCSGSGSSSGTGGRAATGGSGGVPMATGGSGGVPAATGGSGGASATGGAPGTGGAGTGGAASGGSGGMKDGSPDPGGTGGSRSGDASAADGGGAKDGSAGRDASSGGVDSAPVAGGNTIMGTAGGKPFTKIVSALWLGKPDPNNGSPVEVVELFDLPVQCNQITASGWDAMLGTGNGLEIKLGGNAPGAFHAVGNPATVAPGEAAVATTSLGANPQEDAAMTGPLTITAINPGKNITGTFDITLTAGMVKGSFDATYCAAGREP